LAVVRHWHAGPSQRGIARATGLARETVKKYLIAASSLGMTATGPPPSEDQVVALVRLGSVIRCTGAGTDIVVSDASDQPCQRSQCTRVIYAPVPQEGGWWARRRRWGVDLRCPPGAVSEMSTRPDLVAICARCVPPLYQSSSLNRLRGSCGTSDQLRSRRNSRASSSQRMP
jgi:hypothetical protein